MESSSNPWTEKPSRQISQDRAYWLVILVAAVVILRFCYSLTTEFWFKDEDVLQIYLIGLKSFTSGEYPYFGPDVIYTRVQIPGALLGTLVSAGWYLWKIPEAPYVVLNVLLDLSLGLLAWYSSRRLPEVPRLFIWAYVFLTSWSVAYLTRLINPSFVVPAAILFFVGIFEHWAAPDSDAGAIRSVRPELDEDNGAHADQPGAPRRGVQTTLDLSRVRHFRGAPVYRRGYSRAHDFPAQLSLGGAVRYCSWRCRPRACALPGLFPVPSSGPFRHGSHFEAVGAMTSAGVTSR